MTLSAPPDEGPSWYEQYLLGLDESFSTRRQDAHPENWALVRLSVAFIGLDMAADSVDNVDWVRRETRQRYVPLRSAVIFGNTGPENPENAPFFEGFEREAKRFGKPILLVTASEGELTVDHPFPDCPKVTHLVVPRGGVASLTYVTVNAGSDPWIVEGDLFGTAAGGL